MATPAEVPLPPLVPEEAASSPMGGPRVLQGQRRPAPVQAALPTSSGPADVGFLLAQGPGGLVVQQILPGGPAATSGQIRQGDVLIDVDGHD
ncbi:hypothetical protein T484DRAFT_1766326, partial [Baffinella frigidus]